MSLTSDWIIVRTDMHPKSYQVTLGLFFFSHYKHGSFINVDTGQTTEAVKSKYHFCNITITYTHFFPYFSHPQ